MGGLIDKKVDNLNLTESESYLQRIIGPRGRSLGGNKRPTVLYGVHLYDTESIFK
jgi:hypothetical protein